MSNETSNEKLTSDAIGSTVCWEAEGEFQSGTLVAVKGSWATVDQDGDEAKLRLNRLTILENDGEADEEELTEEEAIAKAMAKTLNQYKPLYFSATAPSGARSLNNGDPIAHFLEGKTGAETCALADDLKGFSQGTLLARYTTDREAQGKHPLNEGQIRMNAGNQIRAAWKKLADEEADGGVVAFFESHGLTAWNEVA